jgi:MYXO-CTERM domain-containing protein
MGAIAIALSSMVPRAAEADLVDDTDFTETEWLDTESDITGMAFAPDGSNRLFLTRKGGEVRIVQINPGGSGTLLPTPFATILPIYLNSECGLIGMAFDPDFTSNGYVYFFVTVSSSEQQILRYTASGNIGTGKTTIVQDLPTDGQNHDGGSIGFGADGMLYWGIGDLGNGTGVDGDLASMAAKIGRARRDGSVPGDNPFADGPGGNADYIFARGFRNPFTLTFQPSTDLLWVSVVGTSYEQVFVVRSGVHAGYNDYENDQPTGYITPTLVYRTGGTRVVTLAPGGATRSGGVITFASTTGHRLRQGERVVVTGVDDSSFNGTFYVADGSASVTDTTFTVVDPGPDASSGNGQLNTMAQGRAVAGGTFYDATGFPEAYRGNFFYGDYIDGRSMRAVVGPGTTVQSVDYWSNNQAAPIDQAVGPDGALYTAGYGGMIYRTVYDNPAQGLVVSQQHVRILEGGAIAFSVSLARMPAGNVTVNVSRTAGDTDVSVASGATLTFSTTNWMDPQPVELAAADDDDGDPDQATLTVSSAGLTDVPVTVNVTDSATIILTVNPTTVNIPEGSSRTFTVRLADEPSGNVTVNVSRTAGDSDVTVASGGTRTFTPANYATPQTVTIAGATDADSDNDVATISVTAAGAGTRTVMINVVDSTGPGFDGGITEDAGTADAGTNPGGGGGCGCRVDATSNTPVGALGLSMVGLLLARTRRRRR